ncbi:MAG: DUF86 domain-containing protein [Bacteroidota bacterium]|nr:DUF86 domain-containing protein [Bacteroidota bacterium]
MKLDELVFLEDIKNAIKEIEQFVEAYDFQQFIVNRPSQLIAERLLIVIGEAAVKIKRSKPDLLTHVDKMIGLRNRVVHDYATIDHATVFVILKDHIPLLKKEVQELLRVHG